MKRFFLVFLFLIDYVDLLIAYNISFKVVDINSKPVADCKIKLFARDTLYTTSSDSLGYVSIFVDKKIDYIVLEKDLYIKKIIKDISSNKIIKLDPVVFILPEYSVFRYNYKDLYSFSIESMKKTHSAENVNFNNFMVNYGFLITDYGGEGGLKLLKIRGHRNNDVKFILDDIILNNPQNGTFDLGLLGNLDIKDVNILKDGSGIFNGSGAIGGAVYLNTSLSNKLILGYGSFNFWDMSFEHNLSFFNKWSVSYSLNYQKSDGDYLFKYNSRIKKKRINNNHELGQFFCKIQYKKSDNFFSNFIFLFSNFYRGIPGPIRGPTPESNLLDKNLYFSYSLKKIFDRTFIFKQIVNYNILYEKFVNPPYPKSIHKNYIFYYKATLQKEFNFINLWSEISYNNERINSTNTKNGHSNSFEFSFVPDFNFRDLHILPGVKYILYNNNTYFIYFCSLNRKFNNIKLYSNFSKNYSFPTFNDLYWSPGGNPNLKPEFSYNISVGSNLKFNKISIDLSYYKKKYTNLIMWQPVSAMIWSPFNISSANGYGMEFIGRVILHNYLFLQSKYNFQKMELTNGLSPVYYPEHIFNEIIKFSFKNFDVSFFANFYDGVYYSHDNLLELPSYWLINSVFGFKYGKYYLSLELNNIFNKEYVVVKNYPMPGRNFKLFVSKKF